jgi:hypothetical protein
MVSAWRLTKGFDLLSTVFGLTVQISDLRLEWLTKAEYPLDTTPGPDLFVCK